MKLTVEKGTLNGKKAIAMDIQEVLMLIEEYVEALQPHEWVDEFDKAARSMFDWLKDYGCRDSDIEVACSIVENYTGYHPRQISTLGSALVVKEALYGALNSEALGRRRKPNTLKNPVKWALKNIDFGFGGGNDPFSPR